MLRLRLYVGDIAAWRGVDAIAVSANRTLQGNDNPGASPAVGQRRRPALS